MKKEICTTSMRKGELYFGVEIETLLKAKHFPVFLTKMHELYGSIVTAKHDGTVARNIEDWMDRSIINPTELVVSPMTLECYQNRKWSMIFDNIEIPRGKDGTLGGHIHMTLSAFTRTQLYKYMKFVRTNLDYIKYIGERDFSCNTYCKPHSANGKAVHQAIDLSTNTDRYEILNITSFNTLENRFFNTPYSREQLLKNIEWCHALWNWCKEAPLTFTVQDFHYWLRNNAHQSYQNILRYIGNRNRTYVVNEELYTTPSGRRRTRRHLSSSGDECTCVSCGADIQGDDYHDINGEMYCYECSFYCCSCDQAETGDYTIVDGDVWCESCVDRYAHHCSCCGEVSSCEDFVDWVEFRGESMCEACRDARNIYWCEDCEEYTLFTTEGCAVCTHEHEEEEEEEDTCSDSIVD